MNLLSVHFSKTTQMTNNPETTRHEPALFDDWLDDENLGVADPVSEGAAISAVLIAPHSHHGANPSDQPITQGRPSEPLPFPHRNKLDHFPAFMARSALFRVGRGHSMQPTSWEVKSPNGYQLTATGPRLSMRDKLVWEVAIQLAKKSDEDMEHAFEVSLSDFAKSMGLADRSGKTLNSIWDHLNRLCQVRLAFRLPSGHEGAGSLLATAIKKDGGFYLRVNADFALPAFSHEKQFRIQTSRRMKLTSTLAQWLHDFLSTHSTTYDLTLSYVRDLCGYEGEAKKFPRLLREALTELGASVPELVAGSSIEGSERSSDHWIVKIQRGSEKPQFIMPHSQSTRPSDFNRRAPRPKGQPKRHGGVVL